MKFEDIEKAHREYINEKQKSERKVHKPITKIVLKTFLIEFIVMAIIVSIPLIAISSVERIEPKVWLMTYLATLFVTIILTTITAIFIITFSSYAETNTEKALENYRKLYKKYFIEQQLSKFFNFLKYNHHSGIDEKLLRPTGVLTPTCLYNSNDLVQGRYKDVDFMQADVTICDLDEKSDSDTKAYRTLFEGRWLIFGLSKQFDVNMVITRAGDKKPSLKNGEELTLIKTESNHFNQRFDAYAKDQIEGLAILDPALIERIEKLGDKHGNNVKIYFLNNLVYFAMDSTHDIFEPPLSDRPLDEKNELDRVISDMQMVVDIVNILKLDRKAR